MITNASHHQLREAERGKHGLAAIGFSSTEPADYDTIPDMEIDFSELEPAGHNPYAGGLIITGAPQPGDKVQYRRILSRRENLVLGFLSILSLTAGTAFVTWLIIAPSYPSRHHPAALAGAVALIACMVLIEVIRITQSAILGFFAAFAKDPVPLAVPSQMRIAILTTIVPGKEPLPLVMHTLSEMKKIRYDGICDVWLLDEGDDPEVRAACDAAGVNHFSRRGIGPYNQPSGQFKAKTKHGNHNSWRDMHEDNYDIVAQMDPDHVPVTDTGKDIIARCAGYFNDPDVAFVVAPQVYGNLRSSWIAHGAAVLAYIFHGIIQRGANALGAPLLIGTNHVYRVSAWRQIGGYQDAIIEDHVTSMAVYTKLNPDTGNHWKGVYTPDIVSVGEGPTSFTDFFNQQKRWAFGIWQVIREHSPRMIFKMSPGQGLTFALLQQFYPTVAISWVISNALTATYLLTGASSYLPVRQWAFFWGLSVTSSLALFFWLRRFNLAHHERKSWGLNGICLMFMCIPTYVMAALAALAGKQLTYVVTAKGALTSRDTWRTFLPAVFWLVFAAVLMACSVAGVAAGYLSLRLWLAETVLVCASGPVAAIMLAFKKRHSASS